MHGKSEPLPTLTSPLMMERMLVIDEDQELHLASLSPMKRSTIINVGIRARFVKAWEMTLWTRRWTRFPSHPSRTRLKGQDFLDGSISQRSPFTMVERILWSMWAISTREWLSNEALMCKVFPSSLGPVKMRWFNGQGAGFINSFKGLT